MAWSARSCPAEEAGVETLVITPTRKDVPVRIARNLPTVAWASAGARSRLVTLKRTLACEPSTEMTRPSGRAGATLGASSCSWTGSKLVSLTQS
jgi:hypothetical protein